MMMGKIIVALPPFWDVTCMEYVGVSMRVEIGCVEYNCRYSWMGRGHMACMVDS